MYPKTTLSGRGGRRRAGTSAWPALLLLLSACGGDVEGSATLQGGAGGTGGGGGGAGGSAETARYFLRVDEEPVPDVVLEMDKDKALEVFGEQAAHQIKLLDVDSTAMLSNALDAIRNACGTGWQNDSPDPGYSCSATALGQSFGSGWITSPQFAMVRLLGMTPANANVAGTSLESLGQLLGQAVFADVLAETLGIVKTSPFIPNDKLVEALQLRLLATHPAIDNPDGLIPISMYDGLMDMTPLAAKLGKVGSDPWTQPGEHPGVLLADEGGFVTRSDALGPDFMMRVVAHSNLRWVSGVDLSHGGGSMYLVTADSVLDFDFNDPERLIMTGLAEYPSMDMRFAMQELPGMMTPCTQIPDCKSNYPPPDGTPVAGSVWTLPEWLTEPLVAQAGLLTYGSRVFSACYVSVAGDCKTGVYIGQNGDPPGWAVFYNLLTGVTVPAEQFLWEMLTDVAQVALHDPTGDGVADIAEGSAEPLYELYGIPIGMSKDELIAQIRPTLQSQAAEISDVILGRFWKNNQALDFYLQRAGTAGDPYLFFVGPDDLRADPEAPDTIKPYTYEHPGFYSSMPLSAEHKVSQTVIDGVADTDHEKVMLQPGENVLFSEDDEGRLYRIVVYLPAGGPGTEAVVDVEELL